MTGGLGTGYQVIWICKYSFLSFWDSNQRVMSGVDVYADIDAGPES